MTRFRLSALLCILAPALVGAWAWPVGGDPYTTDTLRQVLGLPPDAPVQATAAPSYYHQSTDVAATAEDGLIVRGTYSHTAARTQAPVVVLVHDSGSSRREFDDFGRFLLDSGVSILAIDLRGYGESTAFADGRELRAEAFERDPKTEVFTQMDRDVSAAVRWLRDNGKIDPQGVFVHGNGFGASAAGKAMGANARDLRGAVMVTPQFTSRGIELVKELSVVQGVPLLVLIGSTDAGNTTVLTRISELNPNVIGRKVETRGVGSALMGDPEFRRHVLAFLNENGRPRP